MNKEQALQHIHQTSWQGQEPGLQRMKLLLEALGNPHKKLRFVHVAGTNGKGSTCACISSVLQCAGYRVGLNTSPYIHRFNERIQVDGAEIPDGDLVALVETMAPVVDALPIRPTEFEWITALAFLYFAQAQCDLVVLEVGLGGLLDASNVIDCPEVAVITALGLDHTAILGDTMEDIAAAKAGIIKQGGSVVYEGSNATGLAVIGAICQRQNATLHLVDFARMGATNGTLLTPGFDVAPYGHLALGLAGNYQPRNALVAITAVEALVRKGYAITPSHIAQGLERVRWPGRFEVVGTAPLVILDGAHNPQGMAAAAQTLASALPGQQVQVVLGLLADKDVTQMLLQVKPFASHVHCVTPPNPRALPAEDLAVQLQTLGMEATAYDAVEQGLDGALALAGTQGTVMALGSLYLCAQVRDWAKNR